MARCRGGGGKARIEFAKGYGEVGRREPAAATTGPGVFPTAKALKQIDLDLHRTFYTHRQFAEPGGEGQQVLADVLAT